MRLSSSSQPTLPPAGGHVVPPDSYPLTTDNVYVIRPDELGRFCQREAYPQPFHLLMLVEAGSGIHTIDDAAYTVAHGQLYYIRLRAALHHVFVPPDKPSGGHA